MSGESESPGYNITIPLAPNAIEVLEQLFFNGPTWDGNIISKEGRNQLFDLKLAGRLEGYSFLLLAGVRLALQNGVERKKEARDRRQRERLSKLDQVEEMFVPRDHCASGPATVQSLERILAAPEPPR